MKILLIAYDNDSHISYFPLGLGYIAAVLRQAGHKVKIYSQDVYHFPDKHLTSYIEKKQPEMVALGMAAGYYQYNKLMAISRAINSCKNRDNFLYVIGGHIASPEPEYFIKLTGCNIVCMGEAEKSICRIADWQKLSDIKGIAYKDYEDIVINERSEPVQNLDSLPFPAWDLFPMDHYVLNRYVGIKRNEMSMSVLTGRGCIYNCNFCYRLEKSQRRRSHENIIEELKELKSRYGITYFAFLDELLMSSRKRTREFCQALINSGLNISFYCNGRLNFADSETLFYLKEAGCKYINYGIESVNDLSLLAMNKKLKREAIITGVEKTIKAGIYPGLNMIWGNLADTKESLKESTDFLLKYDQCEELRTIRPVTPYPGSPLYYTAIEKGLLGGPSDFYEKHINSDLLTVNFTGLKDDDFHAALKHANKKLLINFYNKQLKRELAKAEKLYEGDTEAAKSFRGFRKV